MLVKGVGIGGQGGGAVQRQAGTVVGRAELEGHAQLRRVRLGELKLWKGETREEGCNGQTSPVYLTGSEQGHSLSLIHI